MNNTTGRVQKVIVAAGAALGLTLAGLGVSAAQTEPPPPAEQKPERKAEQKGEQKQQKQAKGAGPRGHGPLGKHGMGAGIHGEFVTPAPAGGYQTMAHQVGEVTEVSATSLTVKSEDGFSRAYVVNDDTVVNAGDNGIGDVKQGDQVHVLAVVRDGKAHAVEVGDKTQVAARHGKWRSRPGS